MFAARQVSIFGTCLTLAKTRHSGGSKGCMRGIIKSPDWEGEKETDSKWPVPSFSTNSIWEGLVCRNSSEEKNMRPSQLKCLADLNDQTSQSRPEKLLFYITISPWVRKESTF